MNIGFVFYGILYGPGGRTGSNRDYRHCWPNIQNMLIKPFTERGHTASVYVSTYNPFEVDAIEPHKEFWKEFDENIRAKEIRFSKFKNSDPFTAKGAALELVMHESNLNTIVFSRLDVHWAKKAAEGNIDFSKFNFLFKEKGWWENHNFACDNLYIWPHILTPIVQKSLHETYCFPRGKPLVDTHALPIKLGQYINENMMNFISDVHEISDVNSYYTCCRNGLPIEEERIQYIHPEVKERFYPNGFT